MSTKAWRDSEPARVLRRQLETPGSRRTVEQVANEIGHERPNLVRMWSAGETRIQIDAAVPLAIAVGVDPGAFLKEVLETYFPVPRGLTIAFDSTMQNEDAIVDLNFKVRETFHRKFKLAATARGISMKELLERSLAAFEQNET